MTPAALGDDDAEVELSLPSELPEQRFLSGLSGSSSPPVPRARSGRGAPRVSRGLAGGTGAKVTAASREGHAAEPVEPGDTGDTSPAVGSTAGPSGGSTVPGPRSRGGPCSPREDLVGSATANSQGSEAKLWQGQAECRAAISYYKYMFLLDIRKSSR